jgi:hypothetical protein
MDDPPRTRNNVNPGRRKHESIGICRSIAGSEADGAERQRQNVALAHGRHRERWKSRRYRNQKRHASSAEVVGLCGDNGDYDRHKWSRNFRTESLQDPQ